MTELLDLKLCRKYIAGNLCTKPGILMVAIIILSHKLLGAESKNFRFVHLENIR